MHTTLLRSTNWASCIRGKGKYREAEGLYKRALVIREKALGASHPDVAQPSITWVCVIRAQGKYSEAEGLYKRALAIREKRSVRTIPTWRQTLNNLANVYRDARQVQRGGGALQARVGDQGKGSRCEPPDVGADPQ